MSAWASPTDFRALMNAICGYTDESVEDVQARIEARRNESTGSSAEPKSRDVRSSPGPSKSQIDALNALIAQAKAVQQHPAE